MRTGWFSLLMLIVLVLCFSSAWAQTDELIAEIEILPDEEEIQLDDVSDDSLSGDEEIDLGEISVTANRTLSSLLGDNHAVTVIEAEAFAGAEDLGAVLERVPGVDVREQGGLGQMSTAQVRGARAHQVLVLVDGIPLAPGAAADLATLPLGLLERVEVVRGPEAARYGSRALGGIVNLVTLQPPSQPTEQDCPTLPLNENLKALFIDPGTGTTTAELVLTAGGSSVGIISASMTRPDQQFFLSHEQARNSYSYSRADGDTSVRRNNETASQTIWASWRTEDATYRAGVVNSQRGVPGSAEFPTLYAKLAQQGIWWQAQTGRSHVALSLHRTRFTDPQPYLTHQAIDLEDYFVHAEYALGTLATQQGRWGIKPRLDYISSDDYGDKSRAGFDAHFHWEKPTGNATVSIDGGIVASSDMGIDPVGRASVSWEFSRDARLYTAASYGVRHPDFTELYLTNMGAVTGNPDINTEKAYSWEIGGSYCNPHMRVDAAAFLTDYHESIVFAPVSGYLVKAINTGPARVSGLEALVDRRLSKHWWWRTAYTWLPIAEYDSGVPLTRRSEHHLNSRLEFSSVKWSGGIGVDYTSSIPADLFGNLVISPRTTLDADIAHYFERGSLSFSITNLFDQDARDNWNYPLPGREVFVTWRLSL